MHHRTASICICLAAMLLWLPIQTAASQETLRLVVNADQGTHTIDKHIHGHFAELHGRDIYDGFWTKAGTVEWHLREDVIEALRRIEISNLRWPGGCFADYYHWKDGIGPREDRPTMVKFSLGASR